jgi:hypothetical protein
MWINEQINIYIIDPIIAKIKGLVSLLPESVRNLFQGQEVKGSEEKSKKQFNPYQIDFESIKSKENFNKSASENLNDFGKFIKDEFFDFVDVIANHNIVKWKTTPRMESNKLASTTNSRITNSDNRQNSININNNLEIKVTDDPNMIGEMARRSVEISMDEWKNRVASDNLTSPKRA